MSRIIRVMFLSLIVCAFNSAHAEMILNDQVYARKVVISTPIFSMEQCKTDYSSIPVDQDFFTAQCMSAVLVADVMRGIAGGNFELPANENGLKFNKKVLDLALAEHRSIRADEFFPERIPRDDGITPRPTLPSQLVEQWIVNNVNLSAIPASLSSVVVSRAARTLTATYPYSFYISRLSTGRLYLYGELYYDMFPSIYPECRPKYRTDLYIIEREDGQFPVNRIQNWNACRGTN